MTDIEEEVMSSPTEITSSKWGRKQWMLLSGAGLAVLVFVTVGVWLFGSREESLSIVPAVAPGDYNYEGFMWEGIVLTTEDAGVNIGGHNDHVADIDVVVLPEGGYRAFFKASGVGIMSAVSPDGLKWEVEEGVRISDSDGDTFPRVVDINGTYHMYFHSGQGIESAVSTDLLQWTRQGVLLAPNRNSDNERGGVEMGDVVRLPNGTYRLYYTGWTMEWTQQMGRPSPNSTVVLSATSPDGIAWTREPGVRFQLQDYAGIVRKVLLREDGSWEMFLNAQGGNVSYRAVSDDGLTWRDEEVSGIFGLDVGTVPLADGSTRFYSGDFLPSFESRDGILGGYIMSSQLVKVPYAVEITEWTQSPFPSRITIVGDPSVEATVEVMHGPPWVEGDAIERVSGSLPLDVRLRPSPPQPGMKPLMTIFITSGDTTTYYTIPARMRQ